MSNGGFVVALFFVALGFALATFLFREVTIYNPPKLKRRPGPARQVLPAQRVEDFVARPPYLRQPQPQAPLMADDYEDDYEDEEDDYDER